jgi:putative PIN family toxin of toxin-antitoxin system
VRIVVDTNVWVSGLLWRGRPWELLCLAEAGHLTLCTTPTILEELFDVLSYDRFQSRLHQLGINPAELIGYAMNLATIFEVPASDPIVLADPEDDVFLWCAEAADVAYVVSGDHHLLDLRSHAGIHTITVHDFLTREFPDEAG